jgi:hypothetical protein
MRKSFPVILLSILIMASCVTALAKPTDNAKLILGTWQPDGNKGTITFRPGGKCEFVTDFNHVKTDIQGTYSLSGSNLNIRFISVDWTSRETSVRKVLTPEFKAQQRESEQVKSLLSTNTTGPITWKSKNVFRRVTNVNGKDIVKTYTRVRK